ncbi:MAG: pyruvate, phosphate dikinase, partial [Thermoplasmata archaeon]|nr:pyruvate, phosphate dikinase [Thermoplasmata archaeon]
MYKTEKHYGDMQDMEFTIEDGELFILQTRTGKRTASAAIKIAVDLVIAGIIPREEALMRIEPATLNQLLHKRLDLSTKVDCMTKGLPASPGAAAGEAVFSADEAQRLKEEEGKDVILVSSETSPEDIHGMIASEGILTSRGGMTSHAAVVARGMGKPCICGCEEMKITKGQFEVKGMIIKEGDWITLDGTTGSVFKGEIPTIDPEMTSEFKVFMKWADSIARMKVKTNAEVPHDVQVAKDFGAEGIGLARTEHMFFGDDRLPWMRRMVLASDEAERKVALDKLLPMQRQDFEEIFTIMDKLPVIIRLLDPPLHEFLPKSTEEIKELSQALDIPVEKIEEAIESQHEFNPMLGFRGCRLGILFPEINAMQARAIFEAGLNVKAKGITPIIQVEIPLIGKLEEYRLIKNIIQDVAKDMQIEGKLEYQIGSMIEVPRAALTADELAAEMDFMSFGTNDLTQMTCGLSRDDAGKFLGLYVEKGVYDKDPFSSIDQEGVGLLMKICIDKARKIKPDMEIGICGEHGGEPESVKFCHRIGIDDVSCSPFRVPIAKLAAAQAVIEERMK